MMGIQIYRILMPDGKIVRGSSVHIDEKVPDGYIPPSDLESDGELLAPMEQRDPKRKVPPSGLGEQQRKKQLVIGPEVSDDEVMDPTPEPTVPRPLGRQEYAQVLQNISELRGTIRPPSVGLDEPEDESFIDGETIEVSHPLDNNPVALASTNQDSSDELYALLNSVDLEPFEPKTFRQARHGGQWDLWKLAAKEEYGSLMENGTWKLVDRPKDRKVLRGKWVWKLKRGPNGEILRHKARWVIKGFFQQQEGTDYFETFASVVKPMSYKAIFAIAASLDWELEQMDVKTAFLYGNIDTAIYMEQPEGCTNIDHPDKVCLLLKALYGLKQAPRVWYQTIKEFLETLGYYPLDSDFSVFVGHGTIVAVYVDDLLIAGPNKAVIQDLKAALSQRFKMTDLGACRYYPEWRLFATDLAGRFALAKKGTWKRFFRSLAMKIADQSLLQWKLRQNTWYQLKLTIRRH